MTARRRELAPRRQIVYAKAFVPSYLMKVLLKLLGAIAALLVLMVIASYFLPRTYRIERSTVIQAPPETIYPLVADLRAWKSWGVWHERDPQMTVNYSESSSGVGAWSAWQSVSEGSGKMTITEQTPNQVVYALEFPDFGTKSTGTIQLVPTTAGTDVVWSDEGDLGMNPMNRWFGLFLERMIGPDFEKGLANMKRLAEK